MVSGGSVVEGGETQLLSARVRKTIQSIKEIVGNHSELDIYAVLKETNMDPNETAQKLLYQGEVHTGFRLVSFWLYASCAIFFG